MVVSIGLEPISLPSQRRLFSDQSKGNGLTVLNEETLILLFYSNFMRTGRTLDEIIIISATSIIC